MIMNIFDIAKVRLLARHPAKLHRAATALVLRPGEANGGAFEGRGEVILPDNAERAHHPAGPLRAKHQAACDGTAAVWRRRPGDLDLPYCRRAVGRGAAVPGQDRLAKADLEAVCRGRGDG